jgi:glycosyltransferase involved in cell wall biosynthesis
MDYYDCGLCSGLGNAGVDVTWYTCDISEPRGSAPIGIARTFRRVWGKDAAWKRGLRFVAGLIRSVVDAKRRGASVAHFHFFHIGVLELAGIWLARMARLRVVATIHDVEAFAPGRKSRRLRDLAYSMCDRLVVHNQVSRGELIDAHGVPGDKVRIIAHGSYVDLVPRNSDRAKSRSLLGLPATGKVVLFFGQIKEVKGLDLLIEAFGRTHTKLGSATLVIAGKVWKDDFSRYQSLIDKHGLAGNCRTHIRYIPDEQIASYYAAADIVVLPYRRIYQSGVLLMAMSLGVPVLASDLPGMTEIVENGRNGFLFRSGDVDDLADKLVAALNDSAALRSVADVALNDMATRFGWNTIGQRTAAMYGELLT